jgi:hypothetical protein
MPPSATLSVRLTHEERARLERDAVGMTLGAYIKWRTFDPDKPPPRVRGKCQTAFKTDPRSASNIDPSTLCSRTGGEARSGQLAQRVAA